MIICIAGKNNIAVNILLYLLDIGIDKDNIYIIPNKTDEGSDNWQRSLLKLAKGLKIKVVTLEEVYKIENLLFLSLEFDKIIKPNKFKTDKLFNIHFSLLPRYKGMFTSIMPILNNEKYTGVTFHKIDSGIDTGDIITQKKFRIKKNDNSRDLYFKYIKYGTKLVKQMLLNILDKKFLKLKKQNNTLSSYFSKSTLDFSNIQIDLNQTAINIHNQIRAFNFREYQVAKVFDNSIVSSKILNMKSNLKSGNIIFEDDICFVISSVDYDLVLYKDRFDDLVEACKSGDIYTVNRLLNIPKIINTQNQNGWTPLIVAIYNNQVEIVKTLLVNGANINITNFKGTTSLMYAKSAYEIYKDDRIISLLLNFGIDIYKQDYINKNVLDYCKENNEYEVLAKINKKNIGDI